MRRSAFTQSCRTSRSRKQPSGRSLKRSTARVRKWSRSSSKCSRVWSKGRKICRHQRQVSPLARSILQGLAGDLTCAPAQQSSSAIGTATLQLRTTRAHADSGTRCPSPKDTLGRHDGLGAAVRAVLSKVEVVQSWMKGELPQRPPWRSYGVRWPPSDPTWACASICRKVRSDPAPQTC